jgi:nitrogen fixation/metabolism regulation signal transduction histidine kinase
LLPAEVALTLAQGEEPSAGALTSVGGEVVRLGYRAALASDGTALVLAAPARLDDRLLDRQRDDLAIFLLFALSLGGLIALAASGVGARQLSRPIRVLRQRALALARGEGAPPPVETPPSEFVPVFRAFDRMTVELTESRRELVRAERVLAWGEMARQVAHEIKNPLTPIRLGVQHLRRARQDGRVDFDAVLESNTARILEEIDRLDEIARAFSRYGLAPLEDAAPVAVDLAAVARDLLALERLGASEVVWQGAIPEGTIPVAAQERALRDVLMNLLENARLAQARTVRLAITREGNGGATVTVTDDGHGIDVTMLPRIFEPHFSTRTSGSGLGLAVSRRLVERWGGSITAVSEAGRGTTMTVRLAAAPRDHEISFAPDGHR